MADVDWATSTVEAAGTKLHLMRAGKGRPVLVLHHETGTLLRCWKRSAPIPPRPGFQRLR